MINHVYHKEKQLQFIVQKTNTNLYKNVKNIYKKIGHQRRLITFGKKNFYEKFSTIYISILLHFY